MRINEMQKDFLNITEVVELTTLSRPVIYRQIKKGLFPKPFEFEGIGRRVVWSVMEINEWMLSNLKRKSA